MENKKLLSELKDLTEKLGVQVQERVLKERPIRVRSGLCMVQGKPRLIVDRKLPDTGKMNVYLDHLAAMEIEGVYMAPMLRDLVEKHRKKNKIKPRKNQPAENVATKEESDNREPSEGINRTDGESASSPSPVKGSDRSEEPV